MAASVGDSVVRADDDASPEHWLLCRAGSRLYALPIAHVVETLRPLPIEPLTPTLPFVLGLCILRGAAVPVVDVGLLFGEPILHPQRLVAVRVGERMVALAVEEVIGLGSVKGADLPPLLQQAAGDVVSAIATLDAELLLILNTARIVSEATVDGAAA